MAHAAHETEALRRLATGTTSSNHLSAALFGRHISLAAYAKSALQRNRIETPTCSFRMPNGPFCRQQTAIWSESACSPARYRAARGRTRSRYGTAMRGQSAGRFPLEQAPSRAESFASRQVRPPRAVGYLSLKMPVKRSPIRAYPAGLGCNPSDSRSASACPNSSRPSR
jgi:hypothetical protein